MHLSIYGEALLNYIDTYIYTHNLLELPAPLTLHEGDRNALVAPLLLLASKIQLGDCCAWVT